MKDILNAIFETEEKVKKEALRCETEASEYRVEMEKKTAAISAEFESLFAKDREEKIRMQDESLKQYETDALNRARISAISFRAELESRKDEVFKSLLSVFTGK